MNLQKPKRYENEEYLEFVRNQPCCTPKCERRRNSKNNKRQVDPHHLKTRGSGGSDLTAVPECDIHHEEIHWSRVKYEEKYNIDLRTVQVEYLMKFIEVKFP